jgi:hypothetical protein
MEAKGLAKQVVAERGRGKFRAYSGALRAVLYEPVNLLKAYAGVVTRPLRALEPHLSLDSIGQVALPRLVHTGDRGVSQRLRHTTSMSDPQ